MVANYPMFYMNAVLMEQTKCGNVVAITMSGLFTRNIPNGSYLLFVLQISALGWDTNNFGQDFGLKNRGRAPCLYLI